MLLVLVVVMLVRGDDAPNIAEFEADYDNAFYLVLEKGQIVEYSDDDALCRSWAIPPGFSLIHKAILALFYFGVLCYLFLGIAIVAVIFMA